MKSEIMYIELKTHPEGHTDRGPAWIGRVSFTRTGQTLIYKGMRFQKIRGDSCANYHDIQTGSRYWISGPKKNGEDRYPWARQARVDIDEDVREEYWTKVRNLPVRVKDTVT